MDYIRHYQRLVRREALAAELARQAKQYAEHVARHCPNCPAKIAHYRLQASEAMLAWVQASEQLALFTLKQGYRAA